MFRSSPYSICVAARHAGLSWAPAAAEHASAAFTKLAISVDEQVGSAFRQSRNVLSTFASAALHSASLLKHSDPLGRPPLTGVLVPRQGWSFENEAPLLLPGRAGVEQVEVLQQLEVLDHVEVVDQILV